jgi:hypothetical protein
MLYAVVSRADPDESRERLDSQGKRAIKGRDAVSRPFGVSTPERKEGRRAPKGEKAPATHTRDKNVMSAAALRTPNSCQRVDAGLRSKRKQLRLA